MHRCSQREIQQIEAGNEHINDALRACNSWWPSLSSHGHVISVKPPDKRGLGQPTHLTYMVIYKVYHGL